MNDLSDVAVYGGGSWGTALACAFARAKPNSEVKLIMRDSDIIREMVACRTNSKYLGETTLPSNIIPTDDLKTIQNCELLIIAVPSTEIMNIISLLLKINISKNAILLIATKGLVESSDDKILLLSEALSLYMKNKVAFISGPSFANELAQNLLTSITVASTDLLLATKIADNIKSDNLIVSTTNDIVTVQIAGAIKNIIAIKSGMYEAMGHKNNAKAWLITEGMKEISILSLALGGKLETLLLPAVVGDLVLTCYSQNSRNTKFGYELYGQEDSQKFLANYSLLVEGVNAAKLVKKFASQHEIFLPVVFSIANSVS